MPMRPEAARVLREGVAIPAHALALTPDRKLDERRQRALTRYYLDAGAGGLAVAVHTTQFEIREPQHALLRPVLELAAEEARGRKPQAVRIAGVCGSTRQAVQEAGLAAELGFDAALVSLAALPKASDAELVDHCRAVGEVLPMVGFYLQPAVGGRVLGYRFWRALCELECVVAIKVAPFDRYRTLDVVRAVAESGRAGEVALYTGNDDHIVLDLVTRHEFAVSGWMVTVRMVGGLLGHWAFWTRPAVGLQAEIRRLHETGEPFPTDLLALGAQITDVNQAVFDVRHAFLGCLPGIHEMLRRSGLLTSRTCLAPELDLSPGQAEEIDRVVAQYPHLSDDAFVKEHLDEWLR
ncbi:MAG: dihydrodipicolinate synthase family protein [Candidatus Bipolaricaulota bacterium]